jgi:alkylated DNA repair dioxygenase AlkB
MSLKFVTAFQSGCVEKQTDAKLRVADLDDEGKELLKKAVAECEANLERNPPILVFNKLARQHRSVGFFSAAKTFGYFYSNSCALSQSPGPAIQALLVYVNERLGARYNGVLVNKYEDGLDYISDHSDAESGLDKSAGVAIISHGGARTMNFKLRKDAPPNSQKFAGGGYKQETKHNSIVVMEGPGFQRTFTHGIAQQKDRNQPRVSFTFRVHDGANEDKKIASYYKSKAKIEELIAKEADHATSEPAAKRAKN